MLISMTGYSSLVVRQTLASGDILSMTVSIKTLNSRFFEVSLKAPYAFSHFELEIQKIAKAILHRGHVYITVHVQDQSVLRNNVVASLSVAKGYVEQLAKLQQELNLQGNVTINDIARLPNVFSIEDTPLDETVRDHLFDVIKSAAYAVDEMRRSEGAALEHDILQRVAAITSLVAVIKTEFGLVFARKQQELNEKLQAISLASPELADTQRSILYASFDKLDVHEELVRLATHLENFSKLVASEKIEKGRQLDFMIQELAREANTIASKSIDAQVTQLAVELKVEIEKLREQIQNIL